MSKYRFRIAIPIVVAAVVAAVALAGAGGDDDDHSGGDQGHDSAAAVDWNARTARIHDDRWTVEFCEGDAPVLCLENAEGQWGGVELSSWPVADLDVLEAAFAEGATQAEALAAYADDFLRIFEADRAEGCGATYEFVPDTSTPISVDGRPGLRYGFRGVVDGVTVEHVVGHAVLTDRTLHLFNAAGLADDGCLGREGEFPMEAFDADTIDLIGRIAAASTLP